MCCFTHARNKKREEVALFSVWKWMEIKENIQAKALNNVRVTRVILVSHFGEWGGKFDMHICMYTHIHIKSFLLPLNPCEFTFIKL